MSAGQFNLRGGLEASGGHTLALPCQKYIFWIPLRSLMVIECGQRVEADEGEWLARSAHGVDSAVCGAAV